MKKFLALILSGVLVALSLASCGSNEGSSHEGSSSESSVSAAADVTAAEVFDAINNAFAEKYEDLEGAIANMPMDVDDATLQEKFGIDPSEVEDYKGQIAGMMTNCDMLIVVKAKEGELDNVVTGLQKAKENQTLQFESYGVMGNLERLDAAKVVTNGNFAALLMVGVMDDEAETADFTEDVKLAEDTFNDTING